MGLDILQGNRLRYKGVLGLSAQPTGPCITYQSPFTTINH